MVIPILQSLHVSCNTCRGHITCSCCVTGNLVHRSTRKARVLGIRVRLSENVSSFPYVGTDFGFEGNVDGILVAVQSNGLAYRLLGITNVEI